MNLISLFFTNLFAIILFIFLIYKKNFFFKISNEYKTIQKIHKSYTPPLGGLVIFISFYLYLFLFYQQSNFFINYNVFIPSIAIIIVGSFEDILNNVKPIIRFIVIFISSFIYCYAKSDFPAIEIWKIGEVINNNHLISVLFFSLCMTTLSNGMNMIDGTNGLSGLTSLSILISILTLIFLFNLRSIDIQNLIILSLLLLTFLFFNFPFGKIFLGDSGAYWLGWILGAITIEIFSHPFLNTWIAPLILFYPTFEVIFSTIRKLSTKKNPMLPDINHLHLKLYFLLKGPSDRNQKFNSFTTLCLMPFWACPVLTIMWVQFKAEIAIYFLLLFSFLYLCFFFLVPKIEKNR